MQPNIALHSFSAYVSKIQIRIILLKCDENKITLMCTIKLSNIFETLFAVGAIITSLASFKTLLMSSVKPNEPMS